MADTGCPAWPDIQNAEEEIWLLVKDLALIISVLISTIDSNQAVFILLLTHPEK